MGLIQRDLRESKMSTLFLGLMMLLMAVDWSSCLFIMTRKTSLNGIHSHSKFAPGQAAPRIRIQ